MASTYNSTGTTTNFGDFNPAVGKLQEQLNGLGANLKVDNAFGDLTQQAYDKYKNQLGGTSSPITPTVGSTIPITSLSSKPLNVPQTSSNPLVAGDTMNGIAPLSDLEKANATKQAEYDKLMGEITGQKNEYNDQNNQILNKQVPLGVLVGEQAAKQRQFQTQIENQLNLLGNIKEGLTSSEKKLADRQSLILNQQLDNSKSIQNIAMKAAEFGAGSDVINRIVGAKTLSEALSNAKGFLTDPQERALKAAQISEIIQKRQATNDDMQVIADAIIAGEQPPDLKGLYSKSSGVRAELARKGYDLTKASQDWTATQKYLATLNGAQQIRLRQATNFAYDSLDLVDSLSNEMKGILSRNGITSISKLNLIAAKNGLYGDDAKSIATRLDNQISDLVSELATVYKGGNGATDESLSLAAKQLNSNWDAKTLASNVDLVRKNLAIRRNSINVGVGGIGQSNYSQNNPLGLDINSNTSDPLGLGI